MAVTGYGKGRFFSHLLEIAANIATVGVALLLSMVLVKNYVLPTASPQGAGPARPAGSVLVGTDMSKRIPDVNWKANGRTLVFVLSTHCHFCTESAPFFRELRGRAGKGIRLIGVLPQPVAESEKYLSGEGVHLDEIRQIPLEKTGAIGTPTLLLVSNDGKVERTWVGKLAPEQQDEAMRDILGARSLGAGARTSIAPQRSS